MKRLIVCTLFFLCLHVKFYADSTDTAPKDVPKKPLVNTLYVLDSIKDLDGAAKNSFSLDEFITLKISGLDSILKYNKKDSLMLWMNGIAFHNLKIWNVNLCSQELTFILERDTSSKSPWNMFYSFPYRKSIKEVNLQLGTHVRCVTTTSKIFIHIREPWMIWAGSVSILLLTLLFIYLVKKKELLKDFMLFNDTVRVVDAHSNDPTNEVLRKDIPYSLARAQLAFWTLIVAFSLIFIWFNTDELGYVRDSVIILLGISGATSVVAKIIDVARKDQAALMSAAQFKEGNKTRGLLTDIMSDEKGISIHRFQLAIFTIGLGLYFSWHVIYYLQMPNFSTSLLLLIGISNSTYAGLKINEK